MRGKTGHYESAMQEGKMYKESLNPRSLCLHEGQILKRRIKADNGQYPQTQTIKIVKLYQHHALCRVNGRHRESFTYNEMSQWKGVKNKIHGNG